VRERDDEGTSEAVWRRPAGLRAGVQVAHRSQTMPSCNGPTESALGTRSGQNVATMGESLTGNREKIKFSDGELATGVEGACHASAKRAGSSPCKERPLSPSHWVPRLLELVASSRRETGSLAGSGTVGRRFGARDCVRLVAGGRQSGGCTAGRWRGVGPEETRSGIICCHSVGSIAIFVARIGPPLSSGPLLGLPCNQRAPTSATSGPPIDFGGNCIDWPLARLQWSAAAAGA